MPQLLDDAKAHATAPVHGHTSGFVDGEKMLVFQKNRKLARRCRALGLLGHLVGDAHGRQTHHVALLDAGVGTGAAFVDAHFAAANDAVNVGLGYALQMAYQEVIEPLASGIFIDFDQADCRRVGSRGPVQRWFAPYNVFHLRVVL